MKYLVTGGAGFIGSHLCEALIGDGNDVICLDNFCDFYSPDTKRKNIGHIAKELKLIEGDILDIKLLTKLFGENQVDTVIHLAAMAGVRPSLQKPALYSKVNVEGTTNLLNATTAAGVENFVFASSSSVYGGDSKAPFTEEQPAVTPLSPYAATKRSAELVCHTYSKNHKIRIAALRLFTVYGPRQRPDLAIHKFTKLVSSGEPITIFGDGEMARDYTYIDDTVDGIVKATKWIEKQNPHSFEIFNLGNDHPITINQLVSLLESLLGVAIQKNHVDVPAGEVPRTWSNNQKSQKILGYNPTMTLEHGLQNFVEWYKKEKSKI